MKYMGLGDIYARWKVYSRQGVDKVRKRKDFPKPAFVINKSGNRPAPVWLALDIIAYEEKNPELTDNKKKREKVAAFAICQLKKNGFFKAGG